MPSEIAQTIVDRIFGDDKAAAIDATNDALSSAAYDAIQQQKLDFAKQMGFDLDDTAQASADEVADQVTDGTEGPQDVDTSNVRKPEDPPVEAPGTPSSVEEPEATAEAPTEEPIEEPENETDS
tara:strand:- start:1364 stop:1735 length:372 start_codon:yes stop_codon:yes gene_type:complete